MGEPLKVRPESEGPQPLSAERCHAEEFCFFVDANYGGNMLYGDNGGGYCGNDDLVATDGTSYRNAVSSWVNNTDYTIDVYGDAGPLWTMFPHQSNSYVGDELNDRATHYVVRGGNCP